MEEIRNGLPMDLDLVIDYNDASRQGVKELFQILRPEADLNQLQIEDFSSGFVNKNLACSSCLTDGIFIRLFTSSWNGIFDGSMYKTISKLLDEKGLSPRLLCTFKNGLVQDIVEGDCLTWKTRRKMADNDVNRATIRAVAAFHSPDVLHLALPLNITDNLNQQVVSDGLAQVYKIWSDFLDDADVPIRLKQGLPLASEMEEERIQLDDMLIRAGAEKAVCHMDINPSNIIIKPDGEVVLIDYDLTAINYTCMDLAGYFHCFMDISNPLLSDYPDTWYRRQTLRYYLECRRELDGKDDHVTARDTDKLYNQVQISRLYWLWRYTLGGPTVYRYSPDKKKGEKLLSHVLTIWSEYKRFKQELLKSKP